MVTIYNLINALCVLRFFNITGKKKCSEIYLIKVQVKESSVEDYKHVLFNNAYAICFFISFTKSYVMDTHLNSNEYPQHIL